jgi:hydrogenase maturation protein HypF
MPRVRLRVTGIVQGVGFRPFVYKLARHMGLTGFVQNDPGGVAIEVQGRKIYVREFVRRLRSSPPPLARIDSIDQVEIALVAEAGFSIVESGAAESKSALLSPDIAVCSDCLREMADPLDRRHLYPFINCTNCGPRFTIIEDVPYDRERTTMRVFAMCSDCAAEYKNPLDRRFHAEPIACPACGPQLRLLNPDGTEVPGDPIAGTRKAIADGKIVAIKGIGGYHLACDAKNSEAVKRLRERKHREQKALAVMVGSAELAKRLCLIQPREHLLLESPACPIVLADNRYVMAKRLAAELERASGRPRQLGPPLVSEEVAPSNPLLGVMLPYAPHHHLLLDDADAWVMTSGNQTDEPIAFDDTAALGQLGEIADLFLVHNRRIETRCDDSVARVIDGEPQILRRSRGYVPDPVELPFEVPPVLAVGAELKNTFALSKGRLAFLSHHIGDLKNVEEYNAFKVGIEHFERMFDIEPKAIAADMHPEYLSTKYAKERGLPIITVQHHHAHVAKCIAEHKIPGKVIGVAFDGAGYGDDGAIWGGEFLVCDLRSYTRVAHLKYVPLPGGDAAAEQPWRMAVSHMIAAFGDDAERVMPRILSEIDPKTLGNVVKMAKSGFNSPPTSSMGRLFDAVSSLTGTCHHNSYEGQAAIELEGLSSQSPQRSGASRRSRNLCRFEIIEGDVFEIDPAPVIRAVVEGIDAGEDVARVSARFHAAVAEMVVEVCRRIAQKFCIRTVCLTGGVYQNRILTLSSLEGLRGSGFEVLINRKVPPNDGGISYGQLAVAGARMRISL